MRIKRLLLPLVLPLCVSSICAQEKLYPHTFSLADVQIAEGPFRHAMNLNVETLLAYDVDRLLAPYLKEAGLEPKAPSFSNWIGLDGHIGGHYLSGLAMHYASSGDQRLYDRIQYIVEEMRRCQLAHGDGYVGGVPNGANLWPEIKAGNVGIIWDYWVPWYNLHKTFAGLRDAWLYTDNDLAKTMFLEFCDWAIQITNNLDDRQMESMLNNEFGGMNEVLADAFAMTNEPKYLAAARRFSHREILDSMAIGVDNLDNMHANTQVPKAVGYQRISELTHDSTFRKASEFFWHTVVSNRSLSLGGNSRREHFPSKQDFLSYMEDREGPESCNTNNMMKLTAGLFREQPNAELMDFYERAMYNHILSTQHPQHGGYVYFTSARPAHYRVYSQVNSAMWCCVGTGMENHGKYGELIYTHVDDSLYVNLFVASALNWKEKGIQVTQETKFPKTGESKIHLEMDVPQKFGLKIRYPSWVPVGAFRLMVGGQEYRHDAQPGTYVTIDRTWKSGDVVEILFPMQYRIEELMGHPEYISLFKGPILMGAALDHDDLTGLKADDHRWAHIAHGPLVSIFDTPILVGDREELLKSLNANESFAEESGEVAIPANFIDTRFRGLRIKPFFSIHDTRYMMYWLHTTSAGLDSLQQRKQAEEAQALLLDQLTLDVVKLGEQQPEVDHKFHGVKANRGIHMGQSYRETAQGGSLSVELTADHQKDLALVITYWGYESDGKMIDIFLNDQLLTTEDVGGKWNQSRFFEQKYVIPEELLPDTQNLKVQVNAKDDQKVPKIFKIRLIRNKDTDDQSIPQANEYLQKT
ncbi:MULTISPECIES: glycoside hydrolase family 127 protein [Sphingobacterium]|uniref:Beta-L-arabinofuranosidase domain-containing protein n=1 Tax=Sphingobacterium populi TaxID=1812824 RepID=A0ABW5UFT2_9SPHI|nr:beta-L-arabinofuranosidase domain-containing protein [Sphingobacterium sp. CFCC 11742]